MVRKKLPDYVFFEDCGKDCEQLIDQARQSDSVARPILIEISSATDCANRYAVDHVWYLPANIPQWNQNLAVLKTLRATTGQLRLLEERVRQDDAVARKFHTDTLCAGNIRSRFINEFFDPSEHFNGNLLLSERTVSGDLAFLLANFTGQGLATASAALPCTDIFRAMCRKGFMPTEIIASLNGKLHTLLPTRMFMAAQLIVIGQELDGVSICNCGMPELLLVDDDSGQVRHRVPSNGVPLGIAADSPLDSSPVHISLQPGDRILMMNAAFSNYGSSLPHHRRVQALLATSAGQPSGHEADPKNRALIEIQCMPELVAADNTTVGARTDPETVPALPETQNTATDRWDYRLTLEGARLARLNPVPAMITQIQELDDLASHHQNLFTLLTELYVNAIDHGLLKLDSALKKSADGFQKYFEERERRLARLQEGWITIRIRAEHNDRGARIIVQVEDSGKGFDTRRMSAGETSEPRYHGRGIVLLRELCESVNYNQAGNRVQVVYCCEEPGISGA